MAPIHASIRALDGTAISHLTFPSTVPVPDASRLHSAEATNTQAADRTKTAKTAKQAQTDFHAYLRETKNTICGRHPIGVLLGALAALEEEYGSKMEVRFTRYEVSGNLMAATASRDTDKTMCFALSLPNISKAANAPMSEIAPSHTPLHSFATSSST
jgi:hypothetical protein